MKRQDFGPDFVWGTATAAYQIEGAFREDGKGESIWDRFSHKKRKIENRDNGDVACDHYHRYESDLDLLRSLAISNYRFSLGWTRIFPEGTGRIEKRGVDFYNRLIDACLSRGITPWVTLYHWDLPQHLEDKGGWLNRDIVSWFEEYTDFCTRTFGDRVKNWMILNEPMAFTAAGYLIGVHAPGKYGLTNFVKSAHHATLAQAAGGRVARANCPDSQVGTTFSMTHIEPWSASDRNERARARFDAAINRIFLDPACGRGYPWDDLKALRKIEKFMKEGDDDRVKFNFDFIGIQNYTREIVKASMFRPYVWLKSISPKKRQKPETEMGWEVYPEGIYHLLKKVSQYPEVKKIFVTENGAAFRDQVTGDRVHDPLRVDFLKNYIAQVLRAKQEGVPVSGYFIWSFLDNFEWAFGYRPRFGIVHVDFETQQRRIKDSGLWFRDFLKGD
ncbi:MAG: beta-glucosidase [Leptospirales bacterium]|nr:beta-glucosidase [Leptospirales bacterium]